jgi:hypothetical protein
MQISTILSDYDGTLSPTYFHSDDKTRSLTNYRNKRELDRVLWKISSKRTIAVASTKDFNFLHNRTRFANIISCMMSIETIILKHADSAQCIKNSCVQNSMLNTGAEIHLVLLSKVSKVQLQCIQTSIRVPITFATA